MGNKLPVPDERMQETIDLLQLNDKHIKKLYKVFKKYDKDRSGTIDIDEFFKCIHERHTTFGDAIFDLIDCDDSGVLDFSEFVIACGTYCMFGPEEVLKFAFFVFDKDKNGFIEKGELDELTNLLHQEGVTSNVLEALKKFDFNGDGKIDFKEFAMLNKQFPMVIYPAFRLQKNMMNYTLGQAFWTNQRGKLGDERDQELQRVERLKDRERQRLLRIKKREIKGRMGFFSYYLCPWKRGRYVTLEEEPKIKEESAFDQALKTHKHDHSSEAGDGHGPEEGGGVAGGNLTAAGKEQRKKDREADRKDRDKKSRAERLARAEKRRNRDMTGRVKK